MFVLKFITKEGNSSHVVSAAKYDKTLCHEHDSSEVHSAIIAVYQNLTDDTPTSYYKIEETPNGGTVRHFSQCFIENISGKTIDRIGPF